MAFVTCANNHHACLAALVVCQESIKHHTLIDIMGSCVWLHGLYIFRLRQQRRGQFSRHYGRHLHLPGHTLAKRLPVLNLQAHAQPPSLLTVQFAKAQDSRQKRRRLQEHMHNTLYQQSDKREISQVAHPHTHQDHLPCLLPRLQLAA